MFAQGYVARLRAKEEGMAVLASGAIIERIVFRQGARRSSSQPLTYW